MNVISKKENQMALLGAYDRFNYGDLLFPIVASNEIKSHGHGINILVHALAQSDMSKYGALKTNSIRSLHKEGTLKNGDAIVFVGGGTLGANWSSMHANLLGQKANWALYYLKRIFGDETLNNVIRFYYGSPAIFPWIMKPQNFSVKVKIAYNAIGGSEFSGLPSKMQSGIIDQLGTATYLSVRDAETKRLLSEVEEKVSIELAPDSAILMSEQFPVEWLEMHADKQTIAEINKSPYICFQANLGYINKEYDHIISVIESIYKKYGLRTIFLPIGRYVGLDDHIGLNRLVKKINTPAVMIDKEASIWDIMLTIAKSSAFIGTSLHGNITSQSFAVPHIGLSERRSKIDYYLETWDIPEQSRCVPLEKVCNYLEQVLSVPHIVRMNKRSELIIKAHTNFKKLVCACGMEWI